jgi:CAAX protease family protein
MVSNFAPTPGAFHRYGPTPRAYPQPECGLKAYRGYLLTRAADIGGRSTTSYWLGIVLVSVLFGYGHYYKGPSGIIDSGIAGLILGTAYMLAGRNLWACIFTHGFIDTFAVIDAFFGWSK